MGYEVKKRLKANSVSWYLQHSTFAGLKRARRHVKKDEYSQLGFRESMTLEEARAWARSLNADKFTKTMENRRNAAQQRLNGDHKAALVYMPQAFVKPFEDEVLTRRFRGVMNGHWRAAQKLIVDIKLAAHEWFRQPEIIYRYFEDHQISLSYSQKILRVLNLWGEFLFYKTNKPYFPVKMPTGKNRERIADSYFDSGKAEKESEPITPDDLKIAKQKMKLENYNWLFISVWLGLRPMEIDRLVMGDKAWYLTQQEGFAVFACYQWKLVSVPRDKRWKFIPLLFPDQLEAIRIIKSGVYKRPLPKFIRKHLCKQANNYGGRKGFEALMRSLGRTFTEAQAWLGHSSIETTWKSYRNQKKVFIER